ncbi:MAG: Na+/H+ antiporter [Actinomycetota bacterium]|nr:Na+/H+ antiporter [Actinomycetota bacterium]
MDFSPSDSLTLVGLLAAAAGLLALADLIRIPYPIPLVLGGLVLGFVPGMPRIELPPDIVLVAVLPPLLYGAAFFSPLRELRANAKPIGLLAIGLVLTTTVAVAAVAHTAIPGIDWPTAFVLGAIVSPTDPTAATAIAQRLGLSRRLVALVEGESLVNDGTALVAYRFAVAAVVTGSFSLAAASGRFVLSIVGGIVVGIAVGLVIREVRRRLDNPPVEITISILSGYFAYLPAEALDVSGILAAVTVGIYMGWHTPELTTAQTRLQGVAVWEILFFLLNAFLFTIIGLQLPVILDGLSGYSTATLIWYAVLVSATVIAARFAWIFATARLQWQSRVVLAWSGMRGAVSLAAALALPLTTDAGTAFPNRELVVFLTFSVILATVVVQGLTLPRLIGVLELEDDSLLEAKEDTKARIHAAEAALSRLEELVDEEWVREDTADRVRRLYDFRRNRFRARYDGGDDGAIEQRSTDYQRLLRELIEAERVAIRALRRERRISDDVMRRVERELDLEEARLE